MTNFSDLGVQLKDFAALVNFWHVTNGIYIWEYVTTLDFELDIILGRRPYRWTILIYSLARASLLVAIILNLVGLSVTAPTNCQVLITLQIVTAYVSLLSASLLILVRILIYLQLRAAWDPIAEACAILNSEEIRPTFIISVLTDTLLLVTMLVGLFRLFNFTDGNSTFGVGRLLWKQGIVWLLIATLAGIPPTASSASFPVYLLSHCYMNDAVPFNVMFQLPSVTTNTIAATRIYRSLVDYTFESSHISSGFSKSDTVSKMKWNKSVPISLNRIEVAVDTAYEQYPTSQTTHGVGTQQGDKPHELRVGSELECDMETGVAK
ncbi:hypothetical protein BGY98DRAFT_1098622 [Russula aff. rugulosa BPL654]|nr:hypothetical protein BGY98DRAFT_1098622 [Russula aff. rugulosa BPL654]